MTKGRFKTKLRQLIIGKHTLKQRVWTALLPAAALTFILFFFGLLDLSESAKRYVDYTPTDILPACLKIWGIMLLALFLAAWLPGGKLHAGIASLYTGLALAFYIQGNYLNPDLGTLDGSTIAWQNYADNALIGLGVFCMILIIPLLVHFFSRKFWETFVILISATLLIMQSVPLGIHLYRDFRENENSAHYILDKSNEYKLGTEENIIVFLLDETSPEDMHNALTEFPDMLQNFRDFTYFTDMNSLYFGTFPCTTLLLTNMQYDCEHMTPNEYFEAAWHSDDAESFYRQMKENGWYTQVYNRVRFTAGTYENEYGKIDNVVKIEGQEVFGVDRSVFKRLVKLSFYRYFPLIMKAPFQISTNDLSGMKALSENETEWDEIRSVQKFWDEGISAGDYEKGYITYHFLGAHDPYRLNEYGHLCTGSSTSSPAYQLAGHFNIISEYISYMKDLEVYDSSTIIITADHGNYQNTSCPFLIKPAGQRRDSTAVSDAPISQTEFFETIARAAGLEPGQFGRSVFDIPENEPRERCVQRRVTDTSMPPTRNHSVCNVMDEYCYTGGNDKLLEVLGSDNYRKIPKLEGFY